MSSPYSSLPGKAFWRPAIADRHFSEFDEVAAGPYYRPNDRIATAGSCFAQHIGRRLRLHGLNFLDFERPPTGFFIPASKRHGFGMFSCRYGNIYTVRQLRQLLQEALGVRAPEDVIWEKDGRFYDALRPSVDPEGHFSPDDVMAARIHHLGRVRALFARMTLFIFTLGLTEAWVSKSDGTVYPTAPGTVAGTYDASKFEFQNFRYNHVMDDLDEFWQLLRELNPRVRMLLTVSPVPLTATASGEHVLVATTQSKATLRAVAGDFAAWESDVSYFPAYELIATHPMRGIFFNPDMRNVSEAGVDHVMSHFFRDAPGVAVPASNGHSAPKTESTPDENGAGETNEDDLELFCDDALLDQFAEAKS
jgi:hypothetical protein